MNSGIPVLHVVGNTLAEAYERAVLEVYYKGVNIKTQYDKPEDPPSIDATVNITVLNPWCDPMIHKFFIGGIADLREYVYELEGYKDCLCRNENDPEDTRWEYLYSSRMTNYGTWLEKRDIESWLDDKQNENVVAEYDDLTFSKRCGPFNINQVEKVIEKLAKDPYNRRSQIITWMPNIDLDVYDPPCLQSIHLRLLPIEKEEFILNTNIRFRSNDLTRAHFMNFFGFIQFIANKILIPLRQKMGKNIHFGRINWQADSLHIYGCEINNVKERFISKLNSTTFDERVLNFFDPDIQEMYKECEKDILEKIENTKKSFGIITKK